MAEPQAVVLQPEADDYDGDSAIGSNSAVSSTASLASSIRKHREENGRTYHAYKEGKYPFPNDEPENDVFSTLVIKGDRQTRLIIVY